MALPRRLCRASRDRDRNSLARGYGGRNDRIDLGKPADRARGRARISDHTGLTGYSNLHGIHNFICDGSCHSVCQSGGLQGSQSGSEDDYR